MTFEEILDHAIAMLQRRGRVTYGTLKRQFQLDNDALSDLKDALLYAHPEVCDDAGRGLMWTGDTQTALPAAAPAGPPAQTPLAYTPKHLAERILTSKAALEGERKQVTVLFADLKGSTELIRDLDPETAQHLLDPALQHMMEAVHRFEGTVNQVLGDGIMALFGAPVAHEDHALRACYAALAMQTAMRHYAEQVRHAQGLEMQIRVGLNSGEVMVRAIGNDLHMDYSAVGQTTHLAARMEQLATPGSIRLTAATLRLVEGLVRVNALGAFPVKGLPDPVEVFELVGATALRRRLQATATQGLTRFVGRQTELDTLQQALAQAGAGHGQVVAVVGEAGVGKSRLAYEFTHGHRTQGWRVLESASVSYGKATPYVPVIDLLRRYAHLEEGDDLRTIRAKVTGQALTLDAALQETIPALLALLDALPEDSSFLTLDPPQRRRRTLDALKRLLLRESQMQPLLLVFEDLHWVDAETQALLDSLVDSLPTTRILLLVNYRPEYQHGWSNKTSYTQLRLDPLPPASAAELLHAVLGDDPSQEPLKQLLIARTAGNPFFLEESVQTLVETGVLVGVGGAYRLTQALPTIQVPATVQAVLAARIDRLPPEEKRLLQTAAVIGTEVSFPLLQAIAELPEEALHRGLAHLQAAEFLYETRLFPEHVYTFKHALTHEVAYGGLLHERRRALHARIVDAMEMLYTDRVAEQVERLAHHALQGEVWDKAVAYCRQAGVKAAARSASREAVACFEQALGALGHLPERRDTTEQAIDIRFDLRNALLLLAENARLFDYLSEAEALAQALDDPHRLAYVSAYLSTACFVMGDNDRALEYGERAAAIIATLGDFSLQIELHFRLGQIYHTIGAYRQALDVLRRNVETLTGDLRWERFGIAGLASVFSRTWLGLCLAEVGEFGEGITLGEEGIQVAETAEQAFSLTSVYYSVGVLYLQQGAFQRALPVLERSLEICQGADIPLVFPLAASALGLTRLLAGLSGSPLPLIEQAVQAAASVRLGYSVCLARLSEAYLLARRPEDAHRLALHTLEFSRTHKERGQQAHALRLLGAIAAHRGPPEVIQAAAHYRQALALAEELGMRPLQAHCHLGLGKLYATIGRQDEARAELSTAIDLYKAMEMTFWLPQAEAALAQV
jgi:class 3 adenylate cyclase/tetratricopeptide (TPR) repeat protein